MKNTIELSNVTLVYLEEYERILQKMMHEMTCITITCSISDNFIKQMIPLHKATIEMSENVLRFTTNLDVQNLAICIIKEEKESIENLKALQNRCCFFHNSNYEVYEYMCSFKEIAEVMFYEMCSAPISNSVNVNFLCEMISHHQGAMRLALNVLRFCICQELIPILQCMIQTQCEQIELMLKLLEGLSDC
ncbi:hypothetical protein AEA09_00480 [Lysinibacillus contaminans]|uniref:DUF305 domain-containing protein n=1 Tax=Lysinibacillus contaminans TaxID=1293441 RepID=A0ABR5K6U4_9BACI|nr:DUF305 domain-containing protein [Lysinibacillus contaminans]KOS71519.1 hypothetical protein AEA09_00480 [Lysinibacillus contaminans]